TDDFVLHRGMPSKFVLIFLALVCFPRAYASSWYSKSDSILLGSARRNMTSLQMLRKPGHQSTASRQQFARLPRTLGALDRGRGFLGSGSKPRRTQMPNDGTLWGPFPLLATESRHSQEDPATSNVVASVLKKIHEESSPAPETLKDINIMKQHYG